MRLVKFAIFGLFIFAFFLVSLASAEVPLKLYEGVKNTETFKIYLDGVGSGFCWANSRVKATGGRPLFCTPTNLALQAENYSQILRDYIEKNMKELMERLGPDYPVEGLLLLGLIETFPCK
jgi:hypothetical protein